jgi:hypothetical protein
MPSAGANATNDPGASPQRAEQKGAVRSRTWSQSPLALAASGYWRSARGTRKVLGMQVIAAPTTNSLAERIAVARSILVAMLLLAAGVTLAWLCLSTPLVSAYKPAGWVTTSDIVVGVLVWGFAIVFPVTFMLLGVTFLATVLDHMRRRRRRPMNPHVKAALGDDHMAATDLMLPGGRRVNELALGPFGVVVFGDAPPASISRAVGTRWEVRRSKGRWTAIEGPVERATRDADRVRGLLSAFDRDFVVRVYAVVVTDDPRVVRTPTCAVVSPKDLASWLAGLPFQRGLTPERRERVAAMIGQVAVHR